MWMMFVKPSTILLPVVDVVIVADVSISLYNARQVCKFWNVVILYQTYNLLKYWPNNKPSVVFIFPSIDCVISPTWEVMAGFSPVGEGCKGDLLVKPSNPKSLPPPNPTSLFSLNASNSVIFMKFLALFLVLTFLCIFSADLSPSLGKTCNVGWIFIGPTDFGSWSDRFSVVQLVCEWVRYLAQIWLLFWGNLTIHCQFLGDWFMSSK